MHPQSGPTQVPGQARHEAPRTGARAGWLLLLALSGTVFIADWALRMLLARQPWSDLPQGLRILALMAVAPLLIAALFAIGKRFRNRRSQLRIVLVVGLAMLLGDAGQVWSRIEQNRQRELASAGIRDAMDVLRRMAGGTEPPATLPDIDPAPRAQGAYGELERAIKTVAGRRLAQHKAYVQALDDIGLPRLFDVNRLARDTGLVESRVILELAGRLLPAYRQQNQQALDDMPALIRSLDIDEEARAKMLDGVAAQRPVRLRDVNRAWDLEARILDEFGGMISLLDDNRPYWAARNGQLLFEREADLARYQAHQAQVASLVREQDQLGTRQLANLLPAALP